MRTLFKLFLYVVILLVISAGIGLFYIDSAVKAGINKFGPEITQTSFHLDSLSTSLFKAKIALGGLEVGNPKGFSEPYALKLDSISVAANRDSLFTDTIIIDSLDISGIDVTYELSGKQSNLDVLNKNIANYIESHKGKTESAPATKSSSAKKVIIKRLSISNAQVQLAVNSPITNQITQATVKLPDLILMNLGEGGKAMSLEQATAYILNLISLNSLDALAKSAYKNIVNLSEATIDQTRAAAEQLVNTGKDTVETLKNTGNNAVETLQNTGKEIDHSLKGLFN